MFPYDTILLSPLLRSCRRCVDSWTPSVLLLLQYSTEWAPEVLEPAQLACIFHHEWLCPAYATLDFASVNTWPHPIWSFWPEMPSSKLVIPHLSVHSRSLACKQLTPLTSLGTNWEQRGVRARCWATVSDFLWVMNLWRKDFLWDLKTPVTVETGTTQVQLQLFNMCFTRVWVKKF